MKIESIEVFPLEYPTKLYFKFFTTPLGHLRKWNVVCRKELQRDAAIVPALVTTTEVLANKIVLG